MSSEDAEEKNVGGDANEPITLRVRDQVRSTLWCCMCVCVSMCVCVHMFGLLSLVVVRLGCCCCCWLTMS